MLYVLLLKQDMESPSFIAILGEFNFIYMHFVFCRLIDCRHRALGNCFYVVLAHLGCYCRLYITYT